MEVLVVYDSYYGNTKAVAEAIAEEVRSAGHEARVHSARKWLPENTRADMMMLGSPTRVARMTRSTKKVVKKLRGSSWGSKPIFTFDTVMPGVVGRPGTWGGTAGQKLHDLAKDMGLNVQEPVLHAEVTDMKGPLAADALEKAKVFAREAMSKVGGDRSPATEPKAEG
jgi:flavorubredoxin